MYKFLGLVQTKLKKNDFFSDPLLFRKSLFIFEQAIFSFGGFKDFSTYLFTLEKLQLSLAEWVISKVTQQASSNDNTELVCLNFKSVNSFLTTLFCRPVDSPRLNGLLLKILDNSLKWVSSPPQVLDPPRVAKLIETMFTLKTVHMNPSYHSNDVYATDNDALFLRFHLGLFDVVKLRIKAKDFNLISLLFPLLIQKFEIFQSKIVRFKFHENFHSIELKIMSKILSYLTLHLKDNFNRLGPQYFLSATIFLNLVRKTSLKQGLPELPPIVTEFYSHFKDLGLSSASSNTPGTSKVDACLFRAIHLLSSNVGLLVNLIVEKETCPPSVWKELRFVLSLFLEIDCSHQMSRVLFSKQGVQLSRILPAKCEKEKSNKVHLLLIHHDMTRLLTMGVDSSFGILASQYFQSILQFLLLPLAQPKDREGVSQIILDSYFPNEESKKQEGWKTPSTQKFIKSFSLCTDRKSVV